MCDLSGQEETASPTGSRAEGGQGRVGRNGLTWGSLSTVGREVGETES